MMERSEKAGFGVALAGHAALFALLSLQLATRPLPVPPPQQAIEVSLAPDVALQQASPAPAAPAPSEAPEQGPPEEEAEPAPPPPEPAPAKPQPAKPKPAPPKPAPAKPAPAKPADPDRLAAVVADAERADADRAAKAADKAARHAAYVEKIKAYNAAKADAARLAAEQAQADRAAAVAKAEATQAAAAKAALARADAAKAAAAARPRGSRLGADFLKGLADAPKAPPSAAAPGAMSAKATADIASAIQRQIQPCADRQVNPGPGAERIRVAVNLKLNRDGSLAAPPRVVNHDGLDVENRRYIDRVDDLAIATFTGCAPLRGLPENLYDVPNGWRSITMRYKLPG